MYNNLYSGAYNPQVTKDRIDGQIAQLQQLKEQLMNTQVQPTNLTQNFQIAPTTNSSIRYVDSLEDVKKAFVIDEAPFFSKDMSVLWLKNNKNEIRTYELNELIPKDEKDLKIEMLMAEIASLKEGMKENEQSNANVDEHASDTIKE